MNPQPNVSTARSRSALCDNDNDIAKQLARTQLLIEASSELRSMASSLRGEAGELRARARLLRDR